MIPIIAVSDFSINSRLGLVPQIRSFGLGRVMARYNISKSGRLLPVRTKVVHDDNTFTQPCRLNHLSYDLFMGFVKNLNNNKKITIIGKS